MKRNRKDKNIFKILLKIQQNEITENSGVLNIMKLGKRHHSHKQRHSPIGDANSWLLLPENLSKLELLPKTGGVPGGVENNLKWVANCKKRDIQKSEVQGYNIRHPGRTLVREMKQLCFESPNLDIVSCRV